MSYCLLISKSFVGNRELHEAVGDWQQAASGVEPGEWGGGHSTPRGAAAHA